MSNHLNRSIGGQLLGALRYGVRVSVWMLLLFGLTMHTLADAPPPECDGAGGGCAAGCPGEDDPCCGNGDCDDDPDHDYVPDVPLLDLIYIPHYPPLPANPCRSAGDAVHVDIVTGNVWTRVPILQTYANEEVDLDLVLRYDSQDRKSTRLNSSHTDISRMPSSA